MRRKVLTRVSKDLHRILQSVGTERGIQGFNGSKATIFDKEAHLRKLLSIPDEVDVYEVVLAMKKYRYSFTPEGFKEYFLDEGKLMVEPKKEKAAA